MQQNLFPKKAACWENCAGNIKAFIRGFPVYIHRWYRYIRVKMRRPVNTTGQTNALRFKGDLPGDFVGSWANRFLSNAIIAS